MQAIAFDLGDTLVEYEGIPLNWQQHYPAALANLAASLQTAPAEDRIAAAGAVLRRYNTRLNPRVEEVAFATILQELCQTFGVATPADEEPCASAFFRTFRQRLRCFPETAAVLARLRSAGVRTGVFTDVPYGMPRTLVLADIADAGLQHAFDVVLTSRDTGFRKPSPTVLQRIADAVGCTRQELSYVGNERKDVDVALAFGCEAILIDRDHHGEHWGQHRTLRSLAEL